MWNLTCHAVDNELSSLPMTEILKNFQKEHASAYDQKFQKLSPFKDALHLSTQIALKSLPTDAHILVVGAGTGAELVFLAKEYPQWQFTAVEPSEDMLDVCRGKLDAEGLSERCRLHLGYVDELPGDAVYHGATSILVSQFLLNLEDRRAFFQAIAERLRPGGRLVTADLAHCGEDHEKVWDLWLQAISLLGGGPEQIADYDKNVKQGVSFFSDLEMKDLLTSAGFERTSHFFRTILINGWVASL